MAAVGRMYFLSFLHVACGHSGHSMHHHATSNASHQVVLLSPAHTLCSTHLHNHILHQCLHSSLPVSETSCPLLLDRQPVRQVTAMKLSAYTYNTKPLVLTDRLLLPLDIQTGRPVTAQKT